MKLVRHRPGTAVSQESLRYVRLDELPFWFPDWAREDPELTKRATALLTELEQFQQWMAGHFGLDDDDTKMHEKKHKTSFMRRFAPEGLATGLVWMATSAPCGTRSRRGPTRVPRRRSAWCSGRSAS